MSSPPAPSPRKLSFGSQTQPFPVAGPSSPRRPVAALASRLPSITSSQPQDFDYPRDPPGSGHSSARNTVIIGFSPPSISSALPTLNESSYTSAQKPHTLNTRLPLLSPSLTTPVDQSTNSVLQYAYPPGNAVETSPRPGHALPSSPRGQYEFPPRSRRNSSAIVSISLSSRSRSRTPRGSSANLPATSTSGNATPSKGGSSTVTPRGEDEVRPVMVQMLDSSTSKKHVKHQMEDDLMDEWQPDGGMLLDDEEAIEDDLDEDEDDRHHHHHHQNQHHQYQKSWTNRSDERQVEDILTKGMLFGEGLEFQGETIRPAVGKSNNGSGDDALPLRRGGSEVGKDVRFREKKVYEVVRQLGSGSYAVVYLVREKNGRKREYALKCLSKQDLEEEQIETQLFEATIHLSLPIHTNIVTLHQTFQTEKWLFLMLELCPGEDLFFWLEKSRDASPPPVNSALPDEPHHPMSSSKFSSSSIPFSSSQLFSNLAGFSSSFNNSPGHLAFSPAFGGSPASLLFPHHNSSPYSNNTPLSHTPPTPSLLSAFSANTLLSSRRLRLIASMFSQMCEAVSICHDAGVSHRDIKPENFICCDSIELEEAAREGFDADAEENFGPQAKRKVVVKLTDFGLATTEEESGDVECGSKPYMSYECRNNLGPNYRPAPADVWSLGIVLINMLFHRNPWKDPTEGDLNFDNFLRDPVGFFLSKFTGIGREVATYLATKVLCVDVENRASAREFGKWIKALPEMIAGKKAISAIKKARVTATAETKVSSTNGLFVKSPIETGFQDRKLSASSALTKSAPGAGGLLSLGLGAEIHSTNHSDAMGSLQTKEELKEEDLPRPGEKIVIIDNEETPSPAFTDTTTPQPTLEAEVDLDADADARSLSTHKRRKRGVRKGKAAQAALAAAAASGDGPSQEERDALLAELAEASQSLARDLSRITSKSPEFDATRSRDEEFPPLGTSPAQVAAAKKSRWKELMKLSSSGQGGNAELAALRQRVVEREAASGGNWSAPAKMQHPKSLWAARSGATASSGISSALSSFGPISSATSSSGMDEEESNWRANSHAIKPNQTRAPVLAHLHSQPVMRHTPRQQFLGEQEEVEEEDTPDADEHRGRREKTIRGNMGGKVETSEERSRARKAALAAAAITGNMEPMGSFGQNPNRHLLNKKNGYSGGHQQSLSLGGPPPNISKYGPLHSSSRPIGSFVPPGSSSPSTITSKGTVDYFTQPPSQDLNASTPKQSSTITNLPSSSALPNGKPSFSSNKSNKDEHHGVMVSMNSVESVRSPNKNAMLQQNHSVGNNSTVPALGRPSSAISPIKAPVTSPVVPVVPAQTPTVVEGPNKPKIKGQIQSLAKMLSGLKTKGKD